MARIICALTLLLVFYAHTHAEDVAPGDLVRLTERDLHIPAHPAPSDTRVHLRFTSGTQATVLSVDAPSGWIEVRGEAVQGGQHTGWIIPQYIASREGGSHPPSGSLSWCPPKGVSTPHPSGRLRVATWNLANLHAQDGQAIFTGPDPSEKRAAVD